MRAEILQAKGFSCTCCGGFGGTWANLNGFGCSLGSSCREAAAAFPVVSFHGEEVVFPMKAHLYL